MKTEMHLLLALLVCAWGLQALESATVRHDTPIQATTNYTIMNVKGFAKSGCQTHCGDLKVPYPFGIISKGNEDRNCSLNSGFDVTCDTSTNPPKAFIKDGNIQIFDISISDSELRVRNFVAENCYDQSGFNYRGNYASCNLEGSPYTFSDANVFTVVGCDDRGSIYQDKYDYLPKGCSTTCHNAEEVREGECLGTGCCQVSVNVFKYYDAYLYSYNNHTTNNISSFVSCGYAFLGEKEKFHFGGLSDLKDAAFKNRTVAAVPIVLDLVIEENKTCAEASQDSDSFACRYNNSQCIDIKPGRSFGGYHCSCKQGYEGNPYLSPGCQDIDECADSTKNDCKQSCNNTLGNYTCSCPHGFDGDGRRNGSGCVAKSSKSKFPLNKFILVIGQNGVVLDPEYFHTGQLTDKSDVYSFGVVLAELLTGSKPICNERSPKDVHLATYFITSLNENRLFQILEPRVVKEGTIDQLETAAQLVKRCLSLNGEERPTMKEVTMELEGLRNFNKHPWGANQHGHEETESLISTAQHSDLYEIQLSAYNTIVHDPEQYSSGTASLLLPSSRPR